MSRCFPYSPPGYALTGAPEEALIESIKFQNGRVKSKKQNEGRREKKDKRKEKKDKTKHNQDESLLLHSQYGEKIWADPKVEFLSKSSKAKPEQPLEGSSLTEEHGRPVCLCAPSTSSDSTETSNKMKRQSSLVDVTHRHGKKIIRIKLHLKKQTQSDALSSEQQPCSMSGRTNLPSQIEGVVGISNRNDKEQIFSTSQLIDTSAKRNIPNPPVTNAVMTPMQRAELQYMSLMDNLFSPQGRDADDDLDWLLKSKNLGSCAERKSIPGNDRMSWSSSSGLWPCAQYLQGVNVYALPFTVLF